MPYHSYQEVATLASEQQRDLLHYGDAVERVWAAWAIGVLIGEQSRPDLLVGLETSPDAGTRRQLLVLLAGFLEHDILRTVAEHDLDMDVRATACQYLFRISSPAQTNHAAFLHHRLLHDPSPIVRLTILEEAPNPFPELQPAELASLANDENLDVRNAALLRLLQITPPEQLIPGIVADRMLLEPDEDSFQNLLQQIHHTLDTAKLLYLAQLLPLPRSIKVLQCLIDRQEQFTWDELATQQHLGNPGFDSVLLELLHPADAPMALPWLLAGITRAAGLPQPTNRPEVEQTRPIFAFARQAVLMLIIVGDDLQVATQRDLDSQAVVKTIGYLESAIADVRFNMYDDDNDELWYHRQIAEYQELHDRLLQLMSES